MPYDMKKLLAGAAIIGAFGFGGSAIAGAANGNPPPAPAAQEAPGTEVNPATEAKEAPGTKVNDGTEAKEAPGTEVNDATEAKEAPGTETNDDAEHGDSEKPVAAADAKRASDVALAEVGNGKVTDVSAETPDGNNAADRPEPGDTPDPAYESKTAFQVEVTKADGSAVEVSLDKSFAVLGTQAGEQHGDEQGEHGEVAPAK